MTKFNRVLQGARAVTGNNLAPRSHRAGTNQVNTYWSGLSGGRLGADAFGGTGVQSTTVSGVKYFYTSFTSTSAFTVTSGGSFDIYLFGGGGGGSQGNGYNGFSQGGFAPTGVQITKTLAVGTYSITVGALGAGAVGYGSPSAGGDSYFDTDTTNKSAGGTGGVSGSSGARLNISGASGVDVSAFIGGASLFKGAGGGNGDSGSGGSGIGGNGGKWSGGGTSAAANTASGGGGSNGSGLPDFFCQNGGNGGSGIVYIRWRQ
jgi:hypothetical protein